MNTNNLFWGFIINLIKLIIGILVTALITFILFKIGVSRAIIYTVYAIIIVISIIIVLSENFKIK